MAPDARRLDELDVVVDDHHKLRLRVADDRVAPGAHSAALSGGMRGRVPTIDPRRRLADRRGGGKLLLPVASQALLDAGITPSPTSSGWRRPETSAGRRRSAVAWPGGEHAGARGSRKRRLRELRAREPEQQTPSQQEISVLSDGWRRADSPRVVRTRCRPSSSSRSHGVAAGPKRARRDVRRWSRERGGSSRTTRRRGGAARPWRDRAAANLHRADRRAARRQDALAASADLVRRRRASPNDALAARALR